VQQKSYLELEYAMMTPSLFIIYLLQIGAIVSFRIVVVTINSLVVCFFIPFLIPTSSLLISHLIVQSIVYITIAECCLQEGGDTVQADVFVTKAGAIVQQDLTFSGSTSTDRISDEHRSLLLRYKYTNARILDANRKFLQAALRYYELSQLQDSEVEEEELILLLGRAATCAILSPAGTQKQRILGLLYKDPRLSTLDSMDQFSTHSILVRKMYTNQILLLKGPQDPCNDDNQNVSFSSRSVLISKFQESLSEHHQQALTADGNSSIVERAFMEHNILAVGKFYDNIFITDLSYILGMADDPWMTEKLVSMMIVEGRLYASIDQVDGLLTFYADKNDTVGAVAAAEWDDSITNFCIQLNRISEDISHQYGAIQGEEITS
jgi:COP9 signalosome complex subunit 4